MVAVKVRTPDIQIYLYKSILRKPGEAGLPTSERYAAKEDFIDITPFLGDSGSVTVTKSVKQIGGGFSITFADKLHTTELKNKVGDKVLPEYAMETLYGLIEQQDGIEIRWWSGEGLKPIIMPIKMRGFVSDIRRSRRIGSNGRPERLVIIEGQDYGKLFQMYQILHIPDYPGSKPLLTGANIFEQFGERAINTITGKDFIEMIVKHAINPTLENLIPPYNGMPRFMKVDASAEGVLSNNYMQDTGSVADLLTNYLDVGIWNELFVESREDGEYIVWRPCPYYDLMSGKLTQPLDETEKADDAARKKNSAVPPFITVPDSKIVAIEQNRTDREVFNFYWCNNQRFDLIDHMTIRMQAAMANEHDGTLTYPNSSVDYFGVRLMSGNSVMGYPELESMSSGFPKKDQEARGGLMTKWLAYRRNVMILNNRDNAVLEKGTIEMAGGVYSSEVSRLLRAGDYIQVLDGGMTWNAYVTQLQETFSPFKQFYATIQFERGTGFAERVSSASGNSPYLKEMTTRRSQAKPADPDKDATKKVGSQVTPAPYGDSRAVSNNAKGKLPN